MTNKLSDAEKKQGIFTRVVDGLTLSASISPCVWMHKGYGLQLHVKAPAGDFLFLRDKAVDYEAVTAADIDRLLGTVTLCACKTCGKPTFDPVAHPSNRDGECETCFMTKIRAQFDIASAKEEAAIAKRDAKYKAKGYTHRVVAVIHPASGGDDRMVDIYFTGEPSNADVQKELKRKGSAVLDDFQIVPI